MLPVICLVFFSTNIMIKASVKLQLKCYEMKPCKYTCPDNQIFIMLLLSN